MEDLLIGILSAQDREFTLSLERPSAFIPLSPALNANNMVVNLAIDVAFWQFGDSQGPSVISKLTEDAGISQCAHQARFRNVAPWQD